MSGHRPFSEKTARRFESKLKLPTGSLDRSGTTSQTVDRVADKRLLERVQGLVDSAIAAAGQRVNGVSEELYTRIVELVYEDCRRRGDNVDAARIGRLVGEILRE